jgi:hypothetical protein
VKQDFWARALVFNTVQDLVSGAEERLEARFRKRAYRYETRINGNIAVGLFKEQFIRLVLEEDTGRKNELFLLPKAAMIKSIVPVRTLPGKERRRHYFNKYTCNQNPAFEGLCLCCCDWPSCGNFYRKIGRML